MDHHPTPADVLLVVEVAETSARADREIKVPLYARGEIPEVWLVELGSDEIEVYREPSSGGYNKTARYGRSRRLSPQAISDIEISIDEALPPTR